MRLTTPQDNAYKTLKGLIKRIESSESKWGIAFIGPSGFGRTTVIRKIEQDLNRNNLRIVYLNLDIPAVCPEKLRVCWDEYVQRVKELLPDIDFSEIEEMKSSLGKMEKITSIFTKNGKRIFTVLDHLEECKDWRDARWPIENHLTDVIVVCDDDIWDEKESDRVVTSFFFKRVRLNMPINYEKDKGRFIEIIKDRFEIADSEVQELYEECKGRTSEGKTPSWYVIFRKADEMEKIGE